MSEKKINAILFDIGETLLNFGKVDTLGLFKQGAKLSYDFIRNSSKNNVGSFRQYWWRSLISLRMHNFISNLTGNDFDATAVLKKAVHKKNLGLSEQQWQHVMWLWYEPLSKFGKTEEKIKETLVKLKEMNLKLGIVSNTFVPASTLEKHLSQFGILDFFTTRLYSYEFNFRKPDPRIFSTAAKKINEKLENILFVGDRIDNDIKPAIKNGMTVVLKKAYTNTNKKTPKGTTTINKLAELPGIIKKINTDFA